MAGLDDYFGPRKNVFDNLDIYDEKPDDNRRKRFDLGLNDKREGEIIRRPNTLRHDYSNVFVPTGPPNVMPNRNLDNGEEAAAVLKYVKIAVSVSTLIAENLLSHPFVVLRRQCQVHNCSQRYHLFPITLLPVVWRLNQSQGLTTLWKGLGSVFLVRGLSLAVEDVISKFTPWPKDFKSHSSLKAHGQHIMLKCLTFAVITPFYSASLVETVQSEVASEKPGVFDVFREGICRLISWSSPQKGRMLPVWNLMGPTVVFGLLKYFISIMIRNISSRIMQLSYELQREREGAKPKDNFNQATIQDIEVTAGFIALVGSETILYPLETILHRLHLQGTRTIIDNLDSGTQVVPILTDFDDVIDCFDETVEVEGVAGLYKGFGALTLQFVAHYLLIKLTKTIVTRAIHIFHGDPLVQESNIKSQLLPNIKAQDSKTRVNQGSNLTNLKLSSPLDYHSSEA